LVVRSPKFIVKSTFSEYYNYEIGEEKAMKLIHFILEENELEKENEE